MLLLNFNLLATAPGGVARLRELILTLAVQGKLVQQDPGDEPASVLLKKIRVEKDRLIAEGKIKRDKPLAEIADEEKPFELPIGWEWERFGVIAGIERGGSPRPIQSFLTNDPDGLNWIKIGDTEKGGKYITSSSEKIRREGLSKTRMVFPGDFLLTNSMSFGRPYITQIEGCIHDGWLRISPPSSLNKDFLYVLLSSRFIRTVFEAAAAGGVVLNLNADKVRTVPIPLPPLAEQSRIVTRVEELMHVCDALEAKGKLEAAQHAQLVSTLLCTLTYSDTPEALAENWQRIATHFDLLLDRPQAIDAFEQTILQLAVRGLLVPQDPSDEPASILLQKIRAEKDRLILEGKIRQDKTLAPIADQEKPFELPVGWELVRLGGLIELISGQHLGPNEYVEGLGKAIPYLTGPADFGNFSPVPSRSTNERRAIAVQDDILITVKGSGVGKLNLVNQSEIAISRQLMAIRPIGLAYQFVMLILQTMAQHFQSKAVGIAIPGIGREDVVLTPIGLPPLPEQSRIVARVEELRSLCAELRQRLSASQTTQAHLAEALVDDVQT